MVIPPPPYIGPRPFEKRDQSRFFGREREAHEISSLILANKFLVLYSASGAGKTSLFNAGIYPLIEDDLEVLPTARVRAGAQGMLPDDANVYTYAILSRWADAQALRRLTHTTLAEFLAARSRRQMEPIGIPMPRLLVFDQFEELFTSYQHRWPQRREFLEQLALASEADQDLRVLIVLREEFLARLLSYADALFSGLKDRYLLEPLRKPAARLAVTGPLNGTGRSFEPPAIEEILRQLMMTRIDSGGKRTAMVEGEFVEPVLLQVVCQRLWAALPTSVSIITRAHVEDLNISLARFYSDVVHEAGVRRGVSERQIREWVGQRLITHPGGTRGTVHVGPKTTAGLPNEVVALLEGKLLRTEYRAGARWLEITHDSLLTPIEQSNRDFFRSLDNSQLLLADHLADTIRQSLGHQAVVVRLNDPYPLPVRWVAADPDLVQPLVSSLPVAGAGDVHCW